MSREMVVAIKRATEPYESKQAKELELAGKPSENFSRGRALYKIAGFPSTSRFILKKSRRYC